MRFWGLVDCRTRKHRVKVECRLQVITEIELALNFLVLSLDVANRQTDDSFSACRRQVAYMRRNSIIGGIDVCTSVGKIRQKLCGLTVGVDR